MIDKGYSEGLQEIIFRPHSVFRTGLCKISIHHNRIRQREEINVTEMGSYSINSLISRYSTEHQPTNHNKSETKAGPMMMQSRDWCALSLSPPERRSELEVNCVVMVVEYVQEENFRGLVSRGLEQQSGLRVFALVSYCQDNGFDEAHVLVIR